MYNEFQFKITIINVLIMYEFVNSNSLNYYLRKINFICFCDNEDVNGTYYVYDKHVH